MKPGPVGLLVAAVALPLLLVLAAGCSSVPGGEVSGSGNAVTKEYDDSGFTGLRVDNAFAATVTRGDAFSVAVTVDDNLVEYLRVEVKGDTLRIGLDPGRSYRGTTLKAEVTLPRLEALEVTGASTVDAQGFSSGDPLALEVSGAGATSLSGVRAGDVTIDVSGAGHVTGGLEAQGLDGEISGAGGVSLEGSAAGATLEVSGAGDLDLHLLTLQNADLELSGGSNASVRVTGTLNVEASGGAQLAYYGSPTLGRMELSGGAEVSRAGD